jgi:hypothetical protein
MEADEILLAVDPSLRGTGFAVLQRSAGKVRCLHFDVIKNSPKLTISGCLLEIHTRLTDAMTRFQPTAMAVESVIYVQPSADCPSTNTRRAALNKLSWEQVLRKKHKSPSWSAHCSASRSHRLRTLRMPLQWASPIFKPPNFPRPPLSAADENSSSRSPFVRSRSRPSGPACPASAGRRSR